MEIEKMIDAVNHGKPYERDSAYKKAAEMGNPIMPLLLEYLDASNSEQKKGAIGLIIAIIREKPFTDYENLLAKLLLIMSNKSAEDKWVVAYASSALFYIKDTRSILLIIEAIEYYEDTEMKEYISDNLSDIIGNKKFKIRDGWTIEEAKEVEREIRKWYEKNKGNMFFDKMGRLRYGDPSKYKPSDQPSDKVINAFTEYVEAMFGVKLDKEKKEILEQQFISFYQRKEYDYIDKWENAAEYATPEERTYAVKMQQKEIKSGRLNSHDLGQTLQFESCSRFEVRKKQGINDPAYDLIHCLCTDLFGDRYEELLIEYGCDLN